VRNQGEDTAGAVRRPLLVTADEHLLDDVLRLATAATVSVDVRAEVGGARAVWGGLFSLCAAVRVLLRRRAGAGRPALA